MKISNLFNSGKTVFSFEVFPPKKTSPIESVYGKLDIFFSLHLEYYFIHSDIRPLSFPNRL